MPTFRYTAIDGKGAECAGTCEGVDVPSVARRLRLDGLFATQIEVAGTGTTNPPREHGLSAFGGRAWRKGFGQRISARERAAFTRQLAVLIRAGLPLVRALEVLARQERNPRFQEIIRELAEAIKGGATLSSAISRHPRVFDRLYANMITAGEAGGALDQVLERLARFQEKSLQLRGKVAAAMFYPVVVLGVALAILVGLLVFVVPRFKQIFAELLKGAPLPPLTQAVLTVSDALKQHAWLVAGLVGALTILFSVLRKRPSVARFFDTTVLCVPLFGPLIQKSLVARFGRTFGTLLASGVPILSALRITQDTCGNRRVAGAIAEIHDQVKSGASVARPLDASGAFPPLVASMVEVGEQTGQLPGMLGKVADIYEEEVDQAVAGLSSLIEPFLILGLALVVGTIVIALFLPIVRIVQLLT